MNGAISKARHRLIRREVPGPWRRTAMPPSVGLSRFRVLRFRYVVFELIQHRLILGAQPCRGLHGHPGRHGVARIAPAPRLQLAQDGVEFGVKRLHRGLDPAQLAQLVEDLLDLTGKLRHPGFATPATGAAWSGSRARLGPPGRAILGRFRSRFGAGRRGIRG